MLFGIGFIPYSLNVTKECVTFSAASCVKHLRMLTVRGAEGEILSSHGKCAVPHMANVLFRGKAPVYHRPDV